MPPQPELDVLYEDNHLLAVNKPALLPTMGVAADRPSLLALARQYIGRKYQKPGNVYLGVVSRLDAPVTGVVLLARTSKAAARLSEQFRCRTARKLYWALVEGEPDPPEGVLEHYLRHDDRHRRVHVTTAAAADAQLARLTYRVLAGNDRRWVAGAGSIDSACHVEIRPETGRKHQIRVQLAKIGHPILGDRKYGSAASFAPGIALHARSLVVEHPVQKTPIEFTAPLPRSWPANSGRAP